MTLAALRAHVEEWRGLNYDDATELLDLIEGTARPEQAIQAYNEPMTPDHHPERMVFTDDGDWVRLVTPWRPVP